MTILADQHVGDDSLPTDSEIFINFDTADETAIEVVDNDSRALGIGLESPVPLAAEEPIQRTPVCPPEFIPKVGMLFASLDEGIGFYEKYAEKCGFVSRKGTERVREGVIRYKYVMCNKAGKSVVKGKQRRSTFRQCCNALIKFKRTPNGQYEVYEFIEPHNHGLQTPNTMSHLTQSRNLTMVHKKMIIDNSKINQGAVKTFRMFKEYVRGYSNIGASEEDFKNFARDVKKFIKASDAQMLIETLMRRKSVCSSFFFDFEVDEEGRLSRVFWADPIMIKNNYLFGDMVSFDSTFRMNTYNMIFAPFTGVDHHKRCVTFAAGLIGDESMESYSWLFQCYVSAMGGRYPKCIITDQDLGIKAGVERVFGEHTQHRLCVWHILKKCSAKLGALICGETTFLSDINACVWGEDIEPKDFEEQWDALIDKHHLWDIQWLKDIHEIRESWVPAYFRDLFLGGLMRTTSRSESENSFFQNFTNPNLTLVEFWIRFESAMDSQRWRQSKLIADSKNTRPRLITPIGLEKHASEMYTPRLFYEFQEEVQGACFSCGVQSLDGEDITVTDHERKRTYVVKFKDSEEDSEMEFSCWCKKFERHGILCRHILLILKEKGIVKIPEKYLLTRWSKLAYNKPIYDANRALIEDCRLVDSEKNKLAELWSELFSTVALVEQKPQGVDDLISLLHDFKVRFSGDGCSSSSSTSKKDKNAEIQTLIGTSIPAEISILPPKKSKNKGSGTGGKRLISEREKAERKAMKPLRLCAYCRKMQPHDIRNCPDNPNRKKK